MKIKNLLITASGVIGQMNLEGTTFLSIQINKLDGNLAGTLYIEFANDDGENPEYVRYTDADTPFVGADTKIMLEIVDCCAQKARLGIDVLSGSSHINGFGYLKGDSE